MLRCDPPTPLTADNLAGHVVYGFATRQVEHPLVSGELVLRDGRLARVDEAEVARVGREAAGRLWQRL